MYAIQASINNLNNYLEQLTAKKENIGDWISEDDAKKRTGLSRSTLLKLRTFGH